MCDCLKGGSYAKERLNERTDDRFHRRGLSPSIRIGVFSAVLSLLLLLLLLLLLPLLLLLINPLLLLLLILIRNSEHENYDESSIGTRNRFIPLLFFRSFFAVSEKNRSSAPLKNRVGHAKLVGPSIVNLVGSIVRP